MSRRRSSPPKLASWLLRARPLGEERRDVTADLLELFHQRAEQHGLRYARRRYYHDVVSLWRTLRPSDPEHPSRARSRWLAGTLQDVTYAVRLFRRYRASAAMAIGGLGVSLAICGSVFSILNATLFKEFGIADPASVVRVLRVHQTDTTNTWSYDDFLRLRAATSHVALGAYVSQTTPFAEQPRADTSERVGVTFVTGNFFSILGGRAVRGRVLAPADDTASASAVLVVSHAHWKRRFHSNESTLGQTVWISGLPFTIIGIADDQFTGPTNAAPAFWAPLSTHAATSRNYSGSPGTGREPVQTFGRLLAGLSHRQATDELTALMQRTSEDPRSASPTSAVLLTPIDQLDSGPGRGDAVTAIALTVIVVALALGLAWVNVANLLLATATARVREMKLRLALGASRFRLIRQLLTESLLLSGASGVIGLALTMWSVPAIASLVQLPATMDVSPDARVCLFLMAISALTGFGAGWLPALRGTGSTLRRIRGDGDRWSGHAPARRFRSMLLGGQTAASLLVLILAVLMTKAAVRAATVDPGFDADQLINVTASFGGTPYGQAEVQTYWQAARERVGALPGVEGTALVLFPPYSGGAMAQSSHRDGRQYTVFINHSTPDFFTTIGLRLVRGRVFTLDEVRENAPVAVISQRLALDYFSGEEPIGGTLAKLHEDLAGLRVIGIVSDAYLARLRQYQASVVYQPLRARSLGAAQLVVRAPQPGATVRDVLGALRGLDPQVRPAATLVADGLGEERREPATIALLAGIVAALAVCLSLVGLVGATLQHVRQRTQEIGLRLAIGATSGDVRALLLKDCLRPVLIGLLAGVILARIGGHTIANVIFGVSPTDPTAIGGALVLLGTAALIAVGVPVRRASRTDPARVLRE